MKNWMKNKIQKGDQAAIVCCSNAQKQTQLPKIKHLEETLTAIGIQPIFSNCIYEQENGSSASAFIRAQELMKFYKDDQIKMIFDISGGDLANGILPYLDYNTIAASSKTFWGYSDLTTVINALYAKTGKTSVLYQIRNLLYQEKQISDFQNTILNDHDDLFRIKYRFIQQKEMTGVVIGGNIRCFLKLAGTEFMPDLNHKILLLESYSGTAAKMETYLCQLQQLGAFSKISGILLGTFTQMEEEHSVPTIETLVKKIAGKDLPIAVTKEIGHGKDSKAIVIGQKTRFEIK